LAEETFSFLVAPIVAEGYANIYGRNVTKRKKAEEKLRESKIWEVTSFYTRNLIEASLDPLVTISAEGKITDVNKAAEQVTGCSREELIGSDFSNYFTEPEKAAAGYKHVFTEGTVRDYPLAIKHKSGKITEVLYNASLYRNAEGQVQGVFAAARDITDRKNLEKQLQEKERLATIGATAGMVGHDIRNPLQAITSDVYLAKTELASIPESEEKKKALESLEEIENNIFYINKIVDDLQDYARPLKPVARDINLRKLVDELLAKNGVPKNINVQVKVSEESSVVADPDLLKRVLGNLVTNAVQAMPEGGELSIKAHKDADDVVITVADTGVGIPKEIKEKLFTPLFTTKSKGQGFGLAVVKRVTESMNSTVSVESEVGKGTKFTIRLPPQRIKQ
jgi:PAS domain S-box-containing protein